MNENDAVAFVDERLLQDASDLVFHLKENMVLNQVDSRGEMLCVCSNYCSGTCSTYQWVELRSMRRDDVHSACLARVMRNAKML